MKYPKSLLLILEQLKKFPGVGQKSAERFAFAMLNWDERHLKKFGETISHLKDNIKLCNKCGCFTEQGLCSICEDATRATKLLCIVASPKDVLTIESTATYHGLYHVLGGLISPLHGKGPEIIDLEKIQQKIDAHQIEEVIVALDSTVEGDATLLYLKKHLHLDNCKLSKLAFGLPVGSSLDYIDASTLSQALNGRNPF